MLPLFRFGGQIILQLRWGQKRTPLPRTGKRRLQRISLFKTGDTYRAYVNYLRNACFYLGEPIDWLSPAVTNIVKRLRLAGKTNFRFPIFLAISDVRKIIKHESPMGNLLN